MFTQPSLARLFKQASIKAIPLSPAVTSGKPLGREGEYPSLIALKGLAMWDGQTECRQYCPKPQEITLLLEIVLASLQSSTPGFAHQFDWTTSTSTAPTPDPLPDFCMAIEDFTFQPINIGMAWNPSFLSSSATSRKAVCLSFVYRPLVISEKHIVL